MILRVARADLLRALTGPQRRLRLYRSRDRLLAAPPAVGSEPAAGQYDLEVTVANSPSAPPGPTVWQLRYDPARSTMTMISPDGAVRGGQIQLAGYGEFRTALSGASTAQALPDVQTRQVPQRFSRIAGALGDPEEVWWRLARWQVVVVGTGRVGSRLAQGLATLGVAKLTLVEPDRIEPHNLDVFPPESLGEAKVTVAARVIAAGQPRASIEILPFDAGSVGAFEAASTADLIISAVDNPNARAKTSRMAAALLVSHLDVGIGTFPTGTGARSWGADIRLFGPGEGCLVCQGGLASQPPDSDTGPFPGGRAGSDPGVATTAVGLALRLVGAWAVGAAPRPPAWLQTNGWETGPVHTTLRPAPGCPICRLRGRGAAVLRHPIADLVATLPAANSP